MTHTPITHDLNVANHVYDTYKADFSALWFVTEETFEVQQSVQEAVDRLNAEFDDEAKQVSLMMHDKVAGFYTGGAGIVQQKDFAIPAKAMQAMFGTADEWAACGINSTDMPFAPEQNVVCFMKDWHRLLKIDQAGITLQMIRNVVQSNYASVIFNEDHEIVRGKRMIILVTPTEQMPEDLPEIEPIQVPLPNIEMLKQAVDHVYSPLVAAGRLPEMTSEQRETIGQAMKGLPYRKAEDTITLVVTRRRGIEAEKGIVDMSAVVRTIEQEKAKAIGRVPGLDYISIDDLPATRLPGYEVMYDNIAESMSITPEAAKYHNMPPLTGFALIGGPGTGKSMAALTAAAMLNRICLKLDIGVAMGGVVGESEENMNKALKVAEAMRAFLWLDDFDKAGMKQASQGDTGDSGVSSRMLNMLLTYMASNPAALICITMNRLSNVPQELLRAGRMDNLYFVQSPCATNRLKIAEVHLERHRLEISNKSQLEKITETHMEDWVGAEIEDAIKKAGRRAIIAKTDVIDLDWLSKYAQAYAPQSRRMVHYEDTKAIEDAGSQLVKIGRTDAVTVHKSTKGQRGQRNPSM